MKMFDINNVSKALKKTVSPTLQFERAEKVLDLSRDNMRIGHTDNVMLVGNSGVGKTHLIKAYCRAHQPYDEKEKTIVPVVRVSLTGKTTHLQCVREILEALGDEFADKGNARECIKRLYKLLRENGVQLVFIDEAHNTLNKHGYNSAVSMTLKGINNNTSVTVVLAGTPKLLEYREDKELKRRFQRVIRLSEMGYKTQEEVDDFKTLLRYLVKALPVENSVDLLNSDWVGRIFLATEGNADFVYKLLLDSLRFMGAEDRRLTREHCAKACLFNEDLAWKADLFEYEEVRIEKLIRTFRETKESVLPQSEIIAKLIGRA
jgi:DNA transposition AAA+ family ATPase